MSIPRVGWYATMSLRRAGERAADDDLLLVAAGELRRRSRPHRAGARRTVRSPRAPRRRTCASASVRWRPSATLSRTFQSSTSASSRRSCGITRIPRRNRAAGASSACSVRAVEHHVAGERHDARERVGERGLPVAFDARDADDLAGAHLERRIRRCALVPEVAVRPRASSSSDAGRRGARGQRGHLAADHLARDLDRRVVSLVTCARDDAARAHHRHALRVRDHFGELVRHDQHRGAALREVGDRREERRDLARRERCRRLVEQQHAGLAVELAQQLDALLDADRQRLDDARRDRRRDRTSRPARARARAPRRRRSPSRACGSRLSSTFSHTRSRSISLKCWCTSPTTPSASTVPSSARTAPYAIAASVDLPAPFSPTSAWISPGYSSRSTPSTACTAPKRLRTPRSVRAERV